MRTSTSAGASLTEVISRPSGKGNKGEVGIRSLEKHFLGRIDPIFEEIPANSTFASPKRTQLLEQALNHLRSISRSISAPHGFSFGDLVLTKPQINIFFFVGHHRDGVSVKEIAKFLHVTKGAVTQFIDTLVEKNLVKREEDARDRRLQRIRLTEFAESRFDQFKKAYYLSLNKLFDALTDQEVEQLVSLLEKLRRSDDANSC